MQIALGMENPFSPDHQRPDFPEIRMNRIKNRIKFAWTGQNQNHAIQIKRNKKSPRHSQTEQAHPVQEPRRFFHAARLRGCEAGFQAEEHTEYKFDQERDVRYC